MPAFARVVGVAALAGTILPPMLFMVGRMPEATMKGSMLVAAVAWFIAAPFWMKVD